MNVHCPRCTGLVALPDDAAGALICPLCQGEFEAEALRATARRPAGPGWLQRLLSPPWPSAVLRVLGIVCVLGGYVVDALRAADSMGGGPVPQGHPMLWGAGLGLGCFILAWVLRCLDDLRRR